MITQEQINKAFPGKSKYPQDIQFYQKLDCSFISLTVEKAGLLLRPEDAYYIWKSFSEEYYSSWMDIEGRDILGIIETYVRTQNGLDTINYRIYSNKLKMFTDDARWPSNQRTWSEFIVTPDGEVVEFVTANGEYFRREKCDQEDFIVKTKHP